MARDTGHAVPKTGIRQAFYAVYELENNRHTLKVTVIEHSLTLYSAEVQLDKSRK